MNFSPPFKSALSECADHMSAAKDLWWIIGSTAMALQGIDPGPIGDIDILTSERDAVALAARLHCENEAGSGTGRFRSKILLRHRTNGIDVEFMAGLKVKHAGGWRSVAPETRQKIIQPGFIAFVPALDELVEIFKLFGRQKDIGRANRLKQALS